MVPSQFLRLRFSLFLVFVSQVRATVWEERGRPPVRDQGHAAGAGSQLGNPVSAALLSKAQYSSAVATQSLCTLSRHVVGSHWAPSRHRQFGQGLMFSLCVFRGLFSVGGCLCGVQSHCAVRQAARVLQKVDSRRNTRGSPSVARSTLSLSLYARRHCAHVSLSLYVLCHSMQVLVSGDEQTTFSRLSCQLSPRSMWCEQSSLPGGNQLRTGKLCHLRLLPNWKQAKPAQ